MSNLNAVKLLFAIAFFALTWLLILGAFVLTRLACMP
jgi:hypothetical protein